VRAVGDADQRMKEDRLRALRALRFASRFGFEIEAATWKAICNSAPYLRRLSAERVKQEIEKTMEQVARPSAAFKRWREAGALQALVGPLHDAPAERFAALDYLPMPTGKRSAERKLLRLAMLFFGDDKRAAEHALRELRFSNQDIAWIARLADARAKLGDAVDAAMLREGGPTNGEMRRWAAEVGRTAVASWWRLNSALWRARAAQTESAVAMPAAGASRERAPSGALSERRAPSDASVKSAYRRLVRIAYRDAIEMGDLQVDGEDLAAAGVPKGPELGVTLRRLLEQVIEDPARNTREELIRLARDVR